MAGKMVDVFLKDRLVTSHSVAVDRVDSPISEQDFIGLGKQAMRRAGYTAEDVDQAKFSVESIPEQKKYCRVEVGQHSAAGPGDSGPKRRRRRSLQA